MLPGRRNRSGKEMLEYLGRVDQKSYPNEDVRYVKGFKTSEFRNACFVMAAFQMLFQCDDLVRLIQSEISVDSSFKEVIRHLDKKKKVSRKTVSLDNFLTDWLGWSRNGSVPLPSCIISQVIKGNVVNYRNLEQQDIFEFIDRVLDDLGIEALRLFALPVVKTVLTRKIRDGELIEKRSELEDRLFPITIGIESDVTLHGAISRAYRSH